MRGSNKNQNSLVKYEILILAVLLSSVCALSFVLTMHTADVNVFVSGARQADYIEKGNFFTRPIMQWELKGAFMREYIYWVYSFAKGFAEFGTPVFMTFVKLGSLLVTIVLLAITARIITKDCYKWFLLLSLFVIGICGTYGCCHVQAELIAVVICLLIYAIAVKTVHMDLKKSIPLLIGTGILISTLFFFKSIFIIMSLSILMAVLLQCSYQESTVKLNQKIGLVIIFSIISLLILNIVVSIINPNEIRNMLNASIYQETIFNSEVTWKSIREDLGKFWDSLLDVIHLYPILGFGFIFGLYQFLMNLKEKEIGSCIERVILWMIPCVFVLFSRQFFNYHYALLIFPALFEIMDFLKKHGSFILNKLKEIPLWFWAIFGFVSIIIYIIGRKWPHVLYHPIIPFLIFVLGFFALFLTIIAVFFNRNYLLYAVLLEIICFGMIFPNYISFFSDRNIKSKDLEQVAYQERCKITVDKNEKCLYLDNGLGSYNLGLESELLEFFPLSLQRITEGSPYINISTYVKNKEQVLQYRGKYACIFEEWFFSGQNQEIANKIYSEYRKIGKIPVYEASWDIFSAPNKLDTYSIFLFERK